MERWYERLFKKLLNAGESEKIARKITEGSSKHSRAKTKRQDYRAHKKARQLMERTSRRINRRT